MESLKNKLITISTVGILALTCILMNLGQAVVQGANGPTVQIDPSQLPLPVTGSSTVSGTVAATQSGPWNVGITGQPIVIKNLDEKGRNPYQQSGFKNCNGTGSGLCDFAFPAVPAGKRLVIEHVSANIGVNPGTGVNGTFLEGAGNAFFALPGSSMASPLLIAVNQPVLAYFDSGQTPFYRVAWSSSSNTGEFSVVISGYMVDLTQ